MDAPQSLDCCGSGYRYPKRVRDLAFQLWAFKCSRRITCVADELASVGLAEGWACLPGERTLRHWADKGDWPAAAAQALRSVAPDMLAGLVTELIAGAVEAMPWFRDVLAGRISEPSSTRVRAILTALSMIGIPDLAHASMRDAIRERDEERAIPISVYGQEMSKTESLAAVKERIGASLAYDKQQRQEGDDGRPPTHVGSKCEWARTA